MGAETKIASPLQRQRAARAVIRRAHSLYLAYLRHQRAMQGNAEPEIVRCKAEWLEYRTFELVGDTHRLREIEGKRLMKPCPKGEK